MQPQRAAICGRGPKVPAIKARESIAKTQSNAHAASDNISGMHDHKYSEQIERMLDVMLCMPKSAWGLVLERVEKKIGAAALRTIILRAYEKSDLRRGVAILDRQERTEDEKRKTESVAAP
jgi:hypothetical protein